MHLGRRRKRSRRKREQLFDPAVELRGCRKQAIVAASSRCRQAVGNFFLHHEDNRRKITVVFQQPQQNVGGDVVRQVADDAGWFGREIQARAQAARLGTEDRIQFDLQDIAFDDFDLGLHGELHAELGRKDTVQFHRDQPPRLPRQHIGDGAAAGADLQHGGLGNIAQRLDNAQSRRFARQKMLSQFGFAWTGLYGRALWHVDPLSFRL